MALKQSEWLNVLNDEYLNSFIPDGGSAVKVALVHQDSLDELLSRITSCAQSSGFYVAAIDSKTVRVDKIEDIFFAVTRQINWDELAEKWLRNLFSENGINIDMNLPLTELDAIAEAHELSRGDLLNKFSRLITNTISKNYMMVKDFRTAIMLLCVEQYNKQEVSPSNAELIKQWLYGEKFSLTDLKKLMIYQKVNRNNARLLLTSLAVWLRIAGYSGLILLLNLNAVVNEFPKEEAIQYRRSRTLDVYEVLRQFIDDTDKMSSFLTLIISDYLLETHPTRGFPEYEALRLRILDDVHIDGHENPLNALVRIESEVSNEIFHA